VLMCCIFSTLLMVPVLLLPATPVTGGLAVALSGNPDRAATEAASYWRGGRVRAAEEPNLLAPLIGVNGSIDYHGEGRVQECMEYYIDKHLEEGVRRRLERRGLDPAKGSAFWKNITSSSPTGVVAFLLMENADRTVHLDLLLSLRCLGSFFAQYPVVIFHTNASSAAELARLRAAAPAVVRLLFEEVQLDFPESVAAAQGGPDAFLAPPRCTMDGKHWWSSHRSCGCRCPAWRPQCWPVNWMHATRFFTAGMFRTQTFQQGGFNYFFRMDTDLFFVEKPSIDPFRLMAVRGCGLGLVYDRISREAPGCHDGFDERTRQFMDSWGYRGMPDEEMLHIGHGPAAAGGQWTIGDARLFSSERYLLFADFAGSGIYSDRWADQLFLLRGLALFGPRAKAFSSTTSDPESICIHSIFAGGIDAGFVHKKGGFHDRHLLRRCGAESVFDSLFARP